MGGFVNKVANVASFGLIDDITGAGAAGDAATDAANIQAQAGQQAILAQQQAAKQGQKFLRPFAQLGQQGLEQAGFLTDPQAQFDFLQSNPLFQLGLDNANQQTNQRAASRGRLSAGDTLEQLSNNVLLQAQPLIQQQKQSISGLLNTGVGLAGSRANIAQGLGAGVGGLLTDIGAAQASGVVGEANANSAVTQGLFNLAGTALLA